MTTFYLKYLRSLIDGHVHVSSVGNNMMKLLDILSPFYLTVSLRLAGGCSELKQA